MVFLSLPPSGELVLLAGLGWPHLALPVCLTGSFPSATTLHPCWSWGDKLTCLRHADLRSLVVQGAFFLIASGVYSIYPMALLCIFITGGGGTAAFDGSRKAFVCLGRAMDSHKRGEWRWLVDSSPGTQRVRGRGRCLSNRPLAVCGDPFQMFVPDFQVLCPEKEALLSPVLTLSHAICLSTIGRSNAGSLHELWWAGYPGSLLAGTLDC